MAKKDASKSQTITPMMQQYLDLKETHKDCLLLFRLGDFYELFFDDALKAAKILDIALTKRGQHLGEDIPMCGVPASNMEPYLSKLIKADQKVALAEQMESPAEAKKRGPKSVVKRDVVRILTPGTLTEEHLLEAHKNHFLMTLFCVKKAVSVSYIDISTGAVFLSHQKLEDMRGFLQKLEPKEILISDHVSQSPLQEALTFYEGRLTLLPHARFQKTTAQQSIVDTYKVKTFEGIGTLTDGDMGALGAALSYVNLTQKGKMPGLVMPRLVSKGENLDIDVATLKNLEIFHNAKGGRENTLYSALNTTKTAGGARLLAQFLLYPLQDLKAIHDRLEKVEAFLKDKVLREKVRTKLETSFDIERTLARITTGRAKPRDLAAMRESLLTSKAVRAFSFEKGFPEILSPLFKDIVVLDELLNHLQNALAFELPANVTDGGIIAPGFHAGLDELRSLRDDSRKLLLDMQARYVRETGITNLRIKHNAIIGYYIETSLKEADNALKFFTHKQTLAGSARFISPELMDLEARIVRAQSDALTLEMGLFEDLVKHVTKHFDDLMQTANALAHMDVFASFAHNAEAFDYTRPQLHEKPVLVIEEGRHPTIEAAFRQKPGGDEFIPNTCTLQNNGLWLMTGPNMAGKSTFLRQNALIILMAHAGSFVPAKKAEIGLVDKLFSRVGASDDLAKGHSTFMVEMIETATILNQATSKSFVILDEVGRGTATFDGVSIAFAVLEHLHNVQKCRGLFATHYLELAEASSRLKNVSCHTMSVREHGQEIVFLHKVIDGVTDKAYGLHVAGLAGIPASVIARAYDLLNHFEKSAGKKNKMPETLPLIDHQMDNVSQKVSEIETMVANVNPDTLTPIDALSFIYKLKSKA